MNYNSLMNKPTINYRELIGDSTVSEVGGITEEEFNTLMSTDLASYYTKAQIDDLFSRSYVYREKSGSIVTFDCPSTSQTIPEVTVGIEATQSGSGDPSPTNVRPISGWSAVNVYDGPTTDPQDATVYTIDLDGTRYGGTLDVVSGELVVDRVSHIFDGTETITIGGSNGNCAYIRNVLLPIPSTEVASNYSSDRLTYQSGATYDNLQVGKFRIVAVSETNTRFIFKPFEEECTVANVTEWLTNNNTQVVYKLATPQTYQLTPTQVNSLLGTNNLWADTGDIEVKCLDRIIPAEE